MSNVLHAATYRWTVEEYATLGRAGIFDQGERVELLNGEIVPMPAISVRHGIAVRLLSNFLARRSRGRYEVDTQNPFNLDDHSRPQPDLTLVDPAVSRQKRHPQPADLSLVIEVSDSTVPYDRGDKLPAYARNGIHEFWILNLLENCLETYSDPDGTTFLQSRIYQLGDRAAPIEFPDVKLRVREFIP